MSLFTTNRVERLWLLAKIEFKLRYYENKLGLFWALIKPLMDILIYYIAFNVVIKQNIPSYVAYLFIGLIVWNFFIECSTGTIQILRSKKFLYENTNMQKMDIYVSTIMSNCIGLLFNFTMFFIYYFFIDGGGNNFSKTDFTCYIYLVPLLLTLFILCTAFSMILSTLFILAKDIQQVWMVISGLLFVLSPIVFKTEDYVKALPIFTEINPMAGIIINFRRVIMNSQPPDFYLMGIDFAYAVFGFLVGLFLLKKLGSKAAEKL